MEDYEISENHYRPEITLSVITGCIKVKWLKLNASEGQKDQYLFNIWMPSGGVDF